MTLLNLRYLHIQSSSCDIERSFSKYKIIFEPSRQTMSQTTLKMLNFLYFNCSEEDTVNDEIEEDDDSNDEGMELGVEAETVSDCDQEEDNDMHHDISVNSANN